MAPLRPELSTALRLLAHALDERGVDWRLGGSALLAALNLTDVVADLDVTVPADALDDVQDALQRWTVAVSAGGAPEPWCSEWIARAVVEGVEVDVIGGFCIVTDAGRVPVPQELGGHLDVEGAAVPLADPGIWWWVYRSYKPEKAELLAAVVPAERRRAIRRSLGEPRPV